MYLQSVNADEAKIIIFVKGGKEVVILNGDTKGLPGCFNLKLSSTVNSLGDNEREERATARYNMLKMGLMVISGNAVSTDSKTFNSMFSHELSPDAKFLLTSKLFDIGVIKSGYFLCYWQLLSKFQRYGSCGQFLGFFNVCLFSITYIFSKSSYLNLLESEPAGIKMFSSNYTTVETALIVGTTVLVRKAVRSESDPFWSYQKNTDNIIRYEWKKAVLYSFLSDHTVVFRGTEENFNLKLDVSNAYDAEFVAPLGMLTESEMSTGRELSPEEHIITQQFIASGPEKVLISSNLHLPLKVLVRKIDFPYLSFQILKYHWREAILEQRGNMFVVQDETNGKGIDLNFAFYERSIALPKYRRVGDVGELSDAEWTEMKDFLLNGQNPTITSNLANIRSIKSKILGSASVYPELDSLP